MNANECAKALIDNLQEWHQKNPGLVHAAIKDCLMAHSHRMRNGPEGPKEAIWDSCLIIGLVVAAAAVGMPFDVELEDQEWQWGG